MSSKNWTADDVRYVTGQNNNRPTVVSNPPPTVASPQWSGNYGGGGASSGASYGNYRAKTCRHEGTKSYKVGDIEIFPCARRNLTSSVIDTFDVISPLLEGSGSELFINYTGIVLWFPIRDFTAPHPLRLNIHARRLIELARKGCRVATFCEGGHGRTGTILGAITAILEPDVDPIDTVRSRHCDHAIETTSQIHAIFKSVNRPIPAKWDRKESAIDRVPFVGGSMDILGERTRGVTTQPLVSTSPSVGVASLPTFGGVDSSGPKGTLDAWDEEWNRLPVEDLPGGESAVVAFPFPESWDGKARKKFRGATNTRSKDGFLICPICFKEILDADSARLRKTKVVQEDVEGLEFKMSDQRVRWAGHNKCQGTPMANDLEFALLEDECPPDEAF